MTNSFANAARQAAHESRTENGAKCWNSTGSKLVDLFGTIGIMRNREMSQIQSAFASAFAEDKLLAVKMAFYARNIRGGLGERYTFRAILKWLANTNPEIVKKNLANILLFGRADDLYTLVGTKAESAMWTFLKECFNTDMANYKAGKPITLLAKWLKSVNASSSKTKELGRMTAKALGMTEAEYRKTLATLRKYINIVEVNMSAKDYEPINYEQVPSRAMNVYRKAFEKNDSERFGAYKASLVKGTATVKADTLYPYDIVEKIFTGWGTCKKDDVLEAQWKALPNYIDGERNIMVIADTSGSMWGRPLSTALGLAIYFAERNKGAYHNLFMNFSENPHSVELQGSTLAQKIDNINMDDWGGNTNFHKALKTILQIAKDNNVPAEEMPVSLVVISDMQFDSCTDARYSWDFYTGMKKEFEDNGYTIPNIVFWNCSNTYGDTFHATSEYQGVQLASGQSIATFKSILANIGKTAYEAMVDTLNDPMYDCVTI